MKYPRRNKKRWVCYPPNYMPGDKYSVAYSNLQMKKILYKFGARAEAFVQFLKREKFWSESEGRYCRSISFWNTPEDQSGGVEYQPSAGENHE